MLKRVSKKTWRRIGIVAGVALFAYLVVGVILAGIGTPPLPPEQSGITLKGAHVTGNRMSTKSWSFDYETAQLSPDGSTGTVTGVRNGIIMKKGKPYAKIAAQQISLDSTNLNFTANGKVHVELLHDPDARSFDTDLVTWTNATKSLVMDHPTYVHSAGQTLQLTHVTVDFQTDAVHIGSMGGGFHVPNP